MSEIVKVQIIFRAPILDKLDTLAKNRYPDKGEFEARSLVVKDAVHWRIEKWEREGKTAGESFWLFLIHRVPISLIKAIAWGKILEPYFK